MPVLSTLPTLQKTKRRLPASGWKWPWVLAQAQKIEDRKREEGGRERRKK